MALNDDLSSKFDDRMNSTDKQLLYCPNNAPDAIFRIMFSGRHISVITGQSSNCLSVLFIPSSNFDGRSSFRAYRGLMVLNEDIFMFRISMVLGSSNNNSIFIKISNIGPTYGSHIIEVILCFSD